MNRLLLSLLTLLFGLPAAAQIADGYYRVKNLATERYIMMIDNKSKGFNTQTSTYDVDALITAKPVSRVISDPASVIYIERYSGNQYNLKAQGTDAHSTVGRYLTITSARSGTYRASATEAGITLYLFDENWNGNEGRLTTEKSGSEFYRCWYINALDANSSDNYFGVKAEVTVGNQNYTSLYASFPFTFASSGMKAYAVTYVDRDLAVWREVEGTVAASTPVIIKCAGTDAASNRLNLQLQDVPKPADNLLKGVYFMNKDIEVINDAYQEYISGNPDFPELPFHFNATKYDPNTMRLLGVTSSGKLGFVKANVDYIPKNRAYLTVPSNSPDEITLVTQDEYEALVAADAVTVTANSVSRAYGDANPELTYTVSGTGTLKGVPTLTCSAVPSSPVGTYDIVVGKGSVTNRKFTPVNGQLTVNKAPLTITAKSYTIKQNEPLPQFEVTYDGFKLGETSAVLSKQPVVTCPVGPEKLLATYPITVSGAEASNYDISYVAGTLTIEQADPIIIKVNDVSKAYGDANPQFTWTATGGTVTGQPEFHCDVTDETEPGKYVISVTKGTLDYPNLVFEPGFLTVTKAPLTISAGGPYTMKETDPRPEFKAVFEGFKLGQTAEVLTQQPVLTTDAPDNNPPGEYRVMVSGAEAANYDITYVEGRLIISAANQIIVMAEDATMTYGDPLPAFTFAVIGGEIQGQPEFTTEATSRSDVGVYTIKISKGTIDYPNLWFVDGSLTIEKAPLTVSVGNYSRYEQEQNPEFILQYEGFRNDDDESVLSVKPVATTKATLDSPVGEYPIDIAGGVATNYTFTYVPGVLTVVAMDAIHEVVFQQPVDIYTLAGRLVRSSVTTTAGLQRGVYIVNGRKLVVK